MNTNNVDTAGTMSMTAAADILGVHVNTVRSWIDAGQLGALILPTGYRRPYVAEVERMMLSHGHEETMRLRVELEALLDHLERQARAVRAALRKLPEREPWE